MDQVRDAALTALGTILLTIAALSTPFGKAMIARLSSQTKIMEKQRTDDAERVNKLIDQMRLDIIELREQLNECYERCQASILELTRMIQEKSEEDAL